MKSFYTYLWLREDGAPYYVGKGRGRRGLYRFGRHLRSPEDPARILIQEHPTEADAFAAEIFLIAHYGRKDVGTGCLRNLTDGGEGASGFVPSLELRNRWSRSRTGVVHKPRSVEQRQRLRTALSEQRKGRTHKGMAPSSATRHLWSVQRQGKRLGSSNPRAKLTEDKVIKIRLHAATGETNASLARRFGVGESAIRFIVRRKVWTHI